MSKAKFDAARELIREGQYAQARILLEGIDHPMAREWLKKLHGLEINAIRAGVGPAPGNVKINVSVEKPKRRLTLRGCGALVGVLVVLAVVGAALPRTPKATAPVATSAPTVTAGGPTATITNTATITSTPEPTATATNTETPAPAPTLEFSGDAATVLGPVDVAAGVWKAKATTDGYMIVSVTPLSGECGAGSKTFMTPGLFLIMAGQATNGAEAVLFSKGCSALIEISNVQSGWALRLEKVG
jgi:hypothetical protein